jgi:hypothetical protein
MRLISYGSESSTWVEGSKQRHSLNWGRAQLQLAANMRKHLSRMDFIDLSQIRSLYILCN